MDSEEMSPATVRVWSRLPDDAREVLETELSPTDLQTLLLDLARTRAGRVNASTALQRWRSDRFVLPSPVDPVLVSAVSGHLWELVRDSPFVGLALSPVTPLGTCTAVGAVDQNRIVSTVRTSEVVSDPTNVLALEAAVRRRDTHQPVHLAACHRVLRAQRFADPAAYAHFELFALVSSTRDAGSARSEADLLITHLGFWQRALSDLIGARWGEFVYTVIESRPMRDRIADTVLPAMDAAVFREDAQRTQGVGYYRTMAFKIMATAEEGALDIGDGGCTGWTADLLSDAKERCLISCVSTERIARLRKG